MGGPAVVCGIHRENSIQGGGCENGQEGMGTRTMRSKDCMEHEISGERNKLPEFAFTLRGDRW